MSPAAPTPARLYDLLHRHHGPQGWWPGESRFEIAVGAVLVQRTSWKNVEVAIRRLKDGGLLVARSLRDVPEIRLHSLLRPVGFYRAKAGCLRRLCCWLETHGGFGRLERESTTELRQALLSIRGIGPETADCILLYAFGRPVFVVDAYSRRILQRTGAIPEARELGYEQLRSRIESGLPADADFLNEFHALLVAHGKTPCAPRPRCRDCPIAGSCEHSQTVDIRVG